MRLHHHQLPNPHSHNPLHMRNHCPKNIFEDDQNRMNRHRHRNRNRTPTGPVPSMSPYRSLASSSPEFPADNRPTRSASNPSPIPPHSPEVRRDRSQPTKSERDYPRSM